MELIQFQNMEKVINQNQYVSANENIKVNEYGDNKDQGINNI